MPIPTAHDTFTLTRRFEASPDAVWQLWADEQLWRRWSRMPGSGASYEHDFRVGGGDHARSVFTQPDGRSEQLENRATYFHLEPPHRLVFAYESIVAELPRWASLVTVTFDPAAAAAAAESSAWILSSRRGTQRFLTASWNRRLPTAQPSCLACFCTRVRQ